MVGDDDNAILLRGFLFANGIDLAAGQANGWNVGIGVAHDRSMPLQQKHDVQTAPAPAAVPSSQPAPANGASLPAGAPAASAPSAPAAAPSDASAADFKTLDQEVQGMKKDVIDLNKDLFVLEEELLFPANTQVAVYVSMDVGAFFALDSVTLKIDNKEVKNYLYTAREADALLKGGVQRSISAI